MSDPNTPGDSNPATNPGGDGVHISGRSVAQGRTGTRTFAILVVALALLILAFASIYGLHAGKLAEKPAGQPGQQGVDSHAVASEFHAPPPSPKQAPPGAPSTTGADETTTTRTSASGS